MAKASKWSGNTLQWQGDTEVVRKLMTLGSDEFINKTIYTAMKLSAEPIQKYMNDFMDSHLEGNSIPFPYTQVTDPKGKGQTRRYPVIRPWWRGQRMNILIGYEIDDYVKGDHEAQKGLQALFLDIGTKSIGGTPRITPTFFVYYAIRNSYGQVAAIQERVVWQALRQIWSA